MSDNVNCRTYGLSDRIPPAGTAAGAATRPEARHADPDRAPSPAPRSDPATAEGRALGRHLARFCDAALAGQQTGAAAPAPSAKATTWPMAARRL